MCLDELARVARKCNSEETQVFQELARQAIYNSDKIDVSAFCLNVMGGKAIDLVGKALSKAIKKVEGPRANGSSAYESVRAAAVTAS